MSRYIDPKTNWEREPENYDVGIYVDRMCFVIPRDETKINCAWLIEPPIINGENYQNIIKNKENAISKINSKNMTHHGTYGKCFSFGCRPSFKIDGIGLSIGEYVHKRNVRKGN